MIAEIEKFGGDVIKVGGGGRKKGTNAQRKEVRK
jgi:hypothetical protein